MPAGNKTLPTDASVEAYLAAIDDPDRRADSVALAALIGKVTKQPARMWGTSIVGFGSYHYVYDSGREGDSSVVGFSSRKGDISVYLKGLSLGQDELLARLGKYKMAKGCLYLRRLADVDTRVLEQLVAHTVAHVSTTYG